MTPLETALHMIDLYNDGSPESYGSDRYIELFAEDARIQLMPSAQAPAGRTMSREDLLGAQAAAAERLRNRHVEVHETVAEGDSVVVRYTFSASTAAAAPGIAAGSRMQMEGTDFYTVRDGKVARYLQLVTVPRFDSP